MNYRDFKAAVALEANEPRDYEQIVFRTPDGTTYNNIKVDFTTLANSKHNVILVDLFNIKPKFKVGDIVYNNNGLYPNVKCTIAEVNEELQYYSYKEINGRTYFKDQDKLMLVKDEEVRLPVEDEDKSLMYLDVKESRAIAASSYASEVGKDTMTSIISKIKSAAAAGRLELKIVFTDYPALNNYKNKDYLETWAKLCGYNTSIYKDCMYIKWY